MQLQLTLSPLSKETYLTFNYQYPLSAVIYKKLALASEEYARFLHEEGYSSKVNSKYFKLFSYSNLKGKFAAEKNSLRLKSPEVSFVLGCYMPEFAENLVKGVFMDQEITLGGPGAKAGFLVKQVSVLPSSIKDDEVYTVTLRPTSPVVVGEKNERGYYNYLSPLDSNFIPLLKKNLEDKFRAVNGPEAEGELSETPLELSLNLFPDKLKSRLITIKSGTPEESKVRGFYGFEIVMKAGGKMVKLGLDAGVGMLNSQGFGFVLTCF